MSPSPAGVDWSAERPVDLSLTNRPTHLPPHFRPSGFSVWALSFFTAFIVSLGDFQSARMPAYVCVCALSYDLVCVFVCMFVCVPGWALMCQDDCLGQLGTSDSAPMTRGNQILPSPCLLYTHILTSFPPCPTCSQTTESGRHTGIHSVQCPVIPSETEDKVQACVSPLY